MSYKLKWITAIFFILIVACSERKEYNYNDLVQIVQKDDIKELNKIVRYLDLNVSDSTGNTILMIAVRKNKAQMVKHLLQLRADPNLKNNEGITALDISRNNKTEEISDIIREFQYKDWEKRNNKFSEDFFEFAINNDNSKITQKFITNGRNVNDAIVSNGLSPIVSALFANSTEIILLLLNNNVSPNESFDTRPIITIAAMFNQYETVKIIIEKGADLNAVDGPLTTALMFAAEEGHLDLVKLLIKSGADATLLDRKNETALDKAKVNKHIETVEFLSENRKE